MVEEEPLEITELLNRVVGRAHRLHAFLSCHSDAHVRRSYHRHVVSAVADRQGNRARLVLFHEHDNQGFLQRRRAGQHDGLAEPCERHEQVRRSMANEEPIMIRAHDER